MKKDNTSMISVRIQKETNDRLENLAELTGRTKTFYIHEALRRTFDDMEKEFLEAEDYRKKVSHAKSMHNGEKEKTIENSTNALQQRAKILKSLREKNGLTTEKAAELMDVETSYYEEVENGKIVRITMLDNWIKFLNFKFG